MSKRLLITSTDLMMVQFLLPHVKNLAGRGYDIEIACSDVGGRFAEMFDAISPHVKKIHKVNLQRSPLSLDNYNGYKELKQIINNRYFDIIWTNEPVMGVVTRLAARNARKKGTKVLYMAHGFHFFKGAPLINWCLFYPIEKMMAHFTDMIICVNQEDYNRAKTFKAKKTEYIHGIGINTERLDPKGVQMTSIRQELGLSHDAFLILSVGELNGNKNQITILKALANLGNSGIHYILCGKGRNEEWLKKKSVELDISSQVHFLGYRLDVVGICSQVNIYVMPSYREGLPVSSLEAMYCGIPLVTSNIRGLIDVNKENINGLLCKPGDYKSFAKCIDYLYRNPSICNKMGLQNRIDVIPYTISNTLFEVEKLIRASLTEPIN